jgi:hypothetical protein
MGSVLGSHPVLAVVEVRSAFSICLVEVGAWSWSYYCRASVAIRLAVFSFQRSKLVCPQPGVDMDKVRDTLGEIP